ncbi:ribosome-recycling factor [Algimonas ampicilliniresistens]|uniref:Ribosome-recycling factor n=1 Tax=Algimonas ampicilliniresistens TaxID=1298735 RepID=A0ABQ5V9K3_9PROT|nr:ribosome recycling factor [Algimonas ampicilliniresistens]GLQ23429.1 ribosome-recycling factor [Algimonas ampicilliniresistens]
MTPFKISDYRKRMDGALDSLRKEFGGLRTGRANAALLDGLVVNAYGSEMPIHQIGSVSVPESRMLVVTVWDKTMVAAVEKALRQSSLGLNPVTDGTTLRIPMPPLTEERRRDLTKVAGTYSENAKIAVRNVRRDAMTTLKRLEKDGDMSENEQKAHEKDVQSATDEFVGKIDDALTQKSAEIMQV